MNYRGGWICVTCLCAMLAAGCAPTRFKIPQPQIIGNQFANGFKDYDKVNADTIRSLSQTYKQFPYATIDQVWDAALRLALQEGVILTTDKTAGLIVFATSYRVSYILLTYPAPDTTDIVEVRMAAQQETMDYQKPEMPGEIKLGAYPDPTFFDRLATQIYSGVKWKYLTEPSPGTPATENVQQPSAL